MGVVNREVFNYFNVSKGKLKYKENGNDMTCNGYTGTMVGIREKAGIFENQPTLKIEVKMKDVDSDSFAIIQMTKEALFAIGFFARIRKVDISKPFTIGVLPSDKNDKISFCYIKQEGYKNPDPKKDGIIDKDKSFPAYTTVKVSGKDVNDYTLPFAEMDAIMKHLNEKLAPVANAEKKAEELVPNTTGADDDLPF